MVQRQRVPGASPGAVLVLAASIVLAGCYQVQLMAGDDPTRGSAVSYAIIRN
ncbi:MAG: hypothetical protein WA006_04745 [Rhodoglobus sp.]